MRFLNKKTHNVNMFVQKKECNLNFEINIIWKLFHVY